MISKEVDLDQNKAQRNRSKSSWERNLRVKSKSKSRSKSRSWSVKRKLNYTNIDERKEQDAKQINIKIKQNYSKLISRTDEREMAFFL